ncbi:MAG: methyltransferase domain-containing protein [Ideonella sp.]|nr:methyltransferase domain-containing protein [Ideonella sp.]MBP6776815.1 methyltransferase domain-containing protein [Piscinibacter sp.]
MTKSRAIIGLADWLQTPAGRYLLDWEQRELDAAVADIFGFHALQLGLPDLDALRANRMPHRWVALDADTPAPAVDTPRAAAALLRCDFDALPLDSQSLDLVILPHTLELARDAHLALGEVERVLRPEGRVVIVGLNPASLWGLRQRLGRLRKRLLPRSARPLYLPSEGEFIAYRRLRDWLRLLSFEVEGGRFGCYRPPFTSAKWLSRIGWIERLGERWWPVFGAVYLLVAVKRVRGMRLVGLAHQQRLRPKAAPAVVAQRRQRQQQQEESA